MTATLWVDQMSGWAARAGVASHIGHYRENNEDYVHVDADYPFALVLDGMGGQAAGEVASQKGAEVIRDALCRGLNTDAAPRELIENALRTGNEAVLELGRSALELRNCGSTVVLALLHQGMVYVSWLGDSPAYRVSAGRIEKLTWEHDLRNVLLRHGIISEAEANEHHIRPALWRFLGSEEARSGTEIPSFTPQHGDRLLLATDGITNVVPEQLMLEVCQSYPDPNACAEELVNLALENGSRDNCTCAVIAFEWTSCGPPPTLAQPAQAARKWWQFWK